MRHAPLHARHELADVVVHIGTRKHLDFDPHEPTDHHVVRAQVPERARGRRYASVMASGIPERGVRLAVGLIVLTAIYNVIEGVIAIASGISANSLTLVAFGADSYLEVLAAGAVLWRLAARDEEVGEKRERRALRLIAVTFLALAAAVVVQAFLSLQGGEGADGSLVGILLLTASLTVMPGVSLAKLWTASRWNLPVLAAEARETIACSYLTLTALAGVLATAALGWWWLDAVAALAMVPWLVREGIEDWRGDVCFEGASPCFCRGCVFGVRRCGTSCHVGAAAQ